MASVNPAFDYFRSIGVNGQVHDQWVTDDDFKCVPKPTLFWRVLGSLKARRNTDIPHVLTKLDDIIGATFPKKRERALFVKGVLENLRLKRDPHLTNLAYLNQILNLFQDAMETQEVKSLYLSTGTIDHSLDVIRKFKTSGCGPWQNTLPNDVIAMIFSYMGLRDHFRAAATCVTWHNAAARLDAFDRALLTPGENFYVSNLLKKNSPALIKTIRENRRFIAEYKTGKLSAKRICPTSISSEIYQCNPVDGDHIIIRDKDSFYCIQEGRTVRIPHAFQEEYAVVSAPSINKLFVVNKDSVTLHSIHEVDPSTGNMITLCSPNLAIPTLRHITYHENKIWMIVNEGSVHVLDLETGNLVHQTWAPKPSDGSYPHHYRDLRHIYTSPYPARTFEMEDLTNPTGPSCVIPNSQECVSLLANTSNAIYVAHHSAKIVALDVKTGQTLKSFPYPAIQLLPPSLQVSNGMLYVLDSINIYALDLLTATHIRTINKDGLQPQIFANKIFTLRGVFSRAVYETSL